MFIVDMMRTRVCMCVCVAVFYDATMTIVCLDVQTNYKKYKWNLIENKIGDNNWDGLLQ